MLRALVVAISLAATPAPWPGGAPRTADVDGALGGNLSGLAVAGPSSLWAVRDGPGALLLLTRDGDRWVPAAGWGDGRPIRYPDEDGTPDAEAVTTVPGDPGAVYVGAERNNDGGGSANVILRVPTAGTGAVRATQRWDLDDVLPSTGGNAGIEGLAWVPDETADASAASGDRPGLFVVGLEATGGLYVVRLEDGGGVELVASVASGLEAVMEVTWRPELRELWALCDDACDGRAAVFALVDRTLRPLAVVRPPEQLAELNDEGFAVLPCAGDTALAVWSDDGATDGHALREATLPCGPVAGLLSGAPPATTAPTAAPTTGPATGSTVGPTVGPTTAPTASSTTAPTAASTTTAAEPTDGGGGNAVGRAAVVAVALGLGGALGVVLARRRR